MACKISTSIVFFLFFIIVFSIMSSVQSANFSDTITKVLNFVHDQNHESNALKNSTIRAHLMKINKPAVKTIQSSDGDIIDCVLFHKQPAFDHPKVKGKKPLNPPENRPKGHLSKSPTNTNIENIQIWSMSNDFCPKGTVPIRRANEQDVIRANSIQRFGLKPRNKPARVDVHAGHEYAFGQVTGNNYYGTKARINVWAPKVANPHEFSLAQLWVSSGSDDHLNTIEAGWQVSPELYGDSRPRIFTYWTRDGYKETGCYNLLCSGFVQTSNKIVIGGSLSHTSIYNGTQFDIGFLVWKEPKHGNWWLKINGILVGYWPSFLFTHLRNHANTIDFGGEIVNIKTVHGFHTSTQMGSGHFASEGFKKASYFRNLQVINRDNKLISLSNFRVFAEQRNCYDVRRRMNKVWGDYFYYGGPGKNSKCL